ncbi:MucR family transcriptional regulator [Sphingomonas sp. MMS24-JH45]
MHEAVSNLSTTTSTQPAEEAQSDYSPAVSVRKSLASKDDPISLIDGKPYKTLRCLAGHGLTPDDYRQRYGLKSDYPMVAESYSQARRDMAKKIGLGRKPGGRSAEAAAPSEPAPAEKAPRGRRKAAAPAEA